MVKYSKRKAPKKRGSRKVRCKRGGSSRAKPSSSRSKKLTSAFGTLFRRKKCETQDVHTQQLIKEELEELRIIVIKPNVQISDIIGSGLLDIFRETKCNSNTNYFSYLGLDKLAKPKTSLFCKY